MIATFRHFIFLIFLTGNFLQFGFADEWNRVFLASFPRSGNHWVRYLAEEATHITTGSVYRDKDPMHLRKKFPWGCFCCPNGYKGDCRYPIPGDTVLIKTHYPALAPRKCDLIPAKKTIRVVRHPIDCFYSFYKYTHSAAQPDDMVSENSIINFIRKWRKFQEFWNRQENVVTVRYEDLINSPAQTLEKILIGAGFDVTQADIERAINKFPPEGNLMKHIKNFRHEDLVLIKEQLKDLMQQFDYTIPL